MIKLYLSETRSARSLLAQVLREEYAIPALPEIARGETGKPYFPGHPGLHFNLSHSGTLALCGVGDEPLGVDVEQIRPRRNSLPRYALTEHEYVEYVIRGATWETFYTLWTRREAWCKFTGEGVARARNRDIPNGLALLSFSGDGWRVSACAASGPMGEILRR